MKIKLENQLNLKPLDEYNKKLYELYDNIEILKNKIISERFLISKRDLSELQINLSKELKNFHEEFIYSCEDIMEYVINNYLFQYATNQVAESIKKNTEMSIISFINNWKDKINPYKLKEILFERYDKYDIKYPEKEYVYITDEKVNIYTPYMWNYILSFFNIE